MRRDKTDVRRRSTARTGRIVDVHLDKGALLAIVAACTSLKVRDGTVDGPVGSVRLSGRNNLTTNDQLRSSVSAVVHESDGVRLSTNAGRREKKGSESSRSE